MSGPQVERLRAGVAGANRKLVEKAQQDWYDGSLLLSTVATSLQHAAPHIKGQIGESGQAAADAFHAVAAKVTERSEQMLAASTALTNAADALKAAEDTRDYIDSHPVADPGPKPTVTPGMDQTHDDINAMRAWNSRSSAASAQASDHETRAQVAADHMDKVYNQSTATMKKVHGKPDPVKPVKDGGTGGGGGSTGGTSPGGTAPSSGGGGRHPTGPTYSTNPGHNDNNTDVHWDPSNPGPNGGGGNDDGGGGNNVVDPWLPPGTEEGGGSTAPTTIGAVPGGGSTTAGSPGGSSLGTTGGVAGALGGGVMGGMTGVTGAVRGPTAVPTGAAAGAGGRAIGSTTRTGASGSALGRGTSASTAGTTGGARSAGGGTGTRSAGAARSAGGGTRGAGKAGS
ncbi:MAG: hypothetical protein JWN22_3131, partial [Nocardioides sp.]|nr:hypothetical protein [Nocardioides sp.]